MLWCAKEGAHGQAHANQRIKGRAPTQVRVLGVSARASDPFQTHSSCICVFSIKACEWQRRDTEAASMKWTVHHVLHIPCMFLFYFLSSWNLFFLLSISLLSFLYKSCNLPDIVPFAYTLCFLALIFKAYHVAKSENCVTATLSPSKNEWN